MLDKDTLLLLTIFAFASILHGISGLGVTLITTTGLANLYSFQYAIILTIFPALVLNAMTWLVGAGSVKHNFVYYLQKYWLLAVMSLIGSLIGAKLILWISSAYLQLMLALVVGFYVLKSVLSSRSGRRIQLPNTKPVLIATGLIAGIIGGATNAMSSILLMYLLSMTDDKDTIAKVGNMCYFLGKVAQIVVLYEPITALSIVEWGLITTLTLASVLFLLLGIRCRHYLPQHRFRQFIFIILTVLGLKVAWQGVNGML